MTNKFDRAVRPAEKEREEEKEVKIEENTTPVPEFDLIGTIEKKEEKRKSKAKSLYLDETVIRQIKAVSKKTGKSESKLVNDILKDVFANYLSDK